jgi:hypothetical protein
MRFRGIAYDQPPTGSVCGGLLIATVSLLAGLLRSAKASSQVTEEQQEKPDGQHAEEPQQPEGLGPLLTAS